MALSNYSDLIENLKDYTLRSDAPFNVFIRLAEQEFAPFIKHYLSEKTVNLSIIEGKIKLPSDFSEARTVKVDGKVAKPISNNGGTLYPTEVGYRQNADELHFVANFAIQTVTLTYWTRIPSLTPSNPTNWLIERFPAVYLHGALARFYRWAKDDQAEALEKQDLAGAIAAVDTDNKRGTKIANPISFGGEEW